MVVVTRSIGKPKQETNGPLLRVYIIYEHVELSIIVTAVGRPPKTHVWESKRWDLLLFAFGRLFARGTGT